MAEEIRFKRSREPALRLPLRELVNGRYFKPAEQFSPGFVVTEHEFKAFRVNVWGNVVRKFINDEATFAVLEIDDFTEVMQLVLFNERVELADGVEEGMRVEAVGKPKQNREGSIILAAEIVNEIDAAKELVKRLENLKSLRELKPLNREEIDAIEAMAGRQENAVEMPEEGNKEPDLFSRC
ncbi:hypothetical protein HZB89_01020 [archaeon]|nr:hypothetical protein [archaeon]